MRMRATFGSTPALRACLGWLTGVVALALLGTVGTARAENVFIQQVGRATQAVRADVKPLSPSSPARASQGHQASAGARPPEGIVPSSGGNRAYTLQTGLNNTVAHLQNGGGNQSAVAILGGQRNNVGVWQGGSGLRSQVTLVGTRGLNVGVLQPARSAPVNLLVARLPNGGLLIKR